MLNPKRATLRNIIIKLSKDKERVLEEARGESGYIQGSSRKTIDRFFNRYILGEEIMA